MENASKALIIAGGVLIALLVISLLVVGWNRLTEYSISQEQIETVEQIIKFNKEFESYNKRVVRGYELISLENLVEDTNRRYSTADGFKELEFYIKFLKDTTLVANIGSDKIKKEITQDYVDIKTFRTYYDKALETMPDLAKIYKESYFQCDSMIYNGENEEDNGKGSAKVQKMYFTQIVKK